MKPKVQLLISVLLTGALIYLYSVPLGPLPPVGNFFHPTTGFWKNAETRELSGSITLDLEGLQEPVEIYFDERSVPHIFAQNDYDLYYAQGYVVARDRLFQMELQAYDAGGRLAEIVGPSVLSRDRNTRQWGMTYGAEQALETIKKDEQMWSIVNAYSDGVNAYIESLHSENLPLEYKILNIKPEEWGPFKSALLMKNLTRTLAAGNSDHQTSSTRKYFGQDYIEKWFTIKPELNDPIIPPTREWDFQADIPAAPDSLFTPTYATYITPFEQEEGVGSNNWAVSGDKTQSGFPILANDPHLNLTLPSIWYEVQLHAPGINTYGVSLQGAPGVIIGFNEDVAWGLTNVGSDVMDWYEIQFKDESKQEYLHDGTWKETRSRIEEYKVRGEEAVLDTVIYTHHGPVSEITSTLLEGRDPVYHAQRWIAHDGSNELRAFYDLNRATNYDDYVEALTFFDAPAQNFVFASNEGDIALWVNGKFPNKWEFQGRTVSDGTDPRYDWQGWIPREQVPHIKNPERGFVSSANQESAAPNYPYYLDDDFAPFERGRRINDLLDQMDNITVDDIQKMQLDNYSYYAEILLPSLIEWVDEQRLTDPEREAIQLMSEWNFFMDAEKLAPSIFMKWRDTFYSAVFTDEYESSPARLRYPSRDRFAEVIKEETEWRFIDNIETEEVETRESLATDSFKQTISELTDQYGEIGNSWQWGYVINNDINHMAQIPGMGKEDLFTGGAPEAINAMKSGNGPSWRMVVEVGEQVRGYGVYPGGQSGNPGSRSYTEFIETWRTGGLFELKFLREKPEISDSFPLKVNLE